VVHAIHVHGRMSRYIIQRQVLKPKFPITEYKRNRYHRIHCRVPLMLPLDSYTGVFLYSPSYSMYHQQSPSPGVGVPWLIQNQKSIQFPKQKQTSQPNKQNDMDVRMRGGRLLTAMRKERARADFFLFNNPRYKVLP